MAQYHPTIKLLTADAVIHLIGIGGSGMSSLAVLLQRAGCRVQGSDVAPSAVINGLRAQGIPVKIGHAETNLGGATLVVRSSAVPDSNVEVLQAQARNLPVLSHAEMIGQLSQTHRTLAVAGTSGKTTTTAMLASILIEAGYDPTALVGGILPSLGSGARLGGGRDLVIEADEYQCRFLHLHPEIAIVTNVEPDHLDFFGSFAAVREAFETFVRRIPADGWIILCADNPGSARLAAIAPDQSVTYGLSESAEWRAAGLTVNQRGGTDFVVYAHGTLVGQFSLQVPGRHNVANAVAAAVAAGRIGVDFTIAATALQGFTGVQRRLERKGESGRVLVFDDYAHHPSKIRASLAALREQHEGRIICLFQPHLHHRLTSLFDDFVGAFADADVVIVSDVYAPVGRGLVGGDRTSRDLVAAITGTTAHYGGSLADSVGRVVSLARPGDLVVTMGAGDVTNAGPELLRAFDNRR